MITARTITLITILLFFAALAVAVIATKYGTHLGLGAGGEMHYHGAPDMHFHG
jgi:hypothetical protein